MLDSAIFWIFSVVSVVAALGAVLNRSNIYAALCLIAVFMSIAGFYLLNNADFLAIAQIIIYAVGLTIIMLFAIMFTGDRPMQMKKASQAGKVAYGIVIAYVLALLVRGAILGSGFQTTGVNEVLAARFTAEGSTTMLGELLFGRYALPFELASILLLAAMIGAIVIAKKRFYESEEEILGEVRLAVDTSSAPTEQAIEALRVKRSLEQAEREAALKQESESGNDAEKAGTSQQ
jgi:NADH:ubiquinone oxidoreductase subunit 6 (subunit J)